MKDRLQSSDSCLAKQVLDVPCMVSGIGIDGKTFLLAVDVLALVLRAIPEDGTGPLGR